LLEFEDIRVREIEVNLDWLMIFGGFSERNKEIEIPWGKIKYDLFGLAFGTLEENFARFF
jgi:hypothetical protein